MRSLRTPGRDCRGRSASIERQDSGDPVADFLRDQFPVPCRSRNFSIGCKAGHVGSVPDQKRRLPGPMDRIDNPSVAASELGANCNCAPAHMEHRHLGVDLPSHLRVEPTDSDRRGGTALDRRLPDFQAR